MVQENHKKLTVIVRTEKEVFGSLFGFFFLLCLFVLKTITLLEDRVYPGKEVGQVELSREMVSSTISLFCAGCCCEHPFCPV